MGKTACIFGSTGLIGSRLHLLLSNNADYEKIIVFNRSAQSTNIPKTEQIVGDYGSLIQYQKELNADEYYCCLGTTMKKAGSEEAFEFVDYHLPVSIGQLAVQNQIAKVLVVSSIGASAQSSNFYLRTKGRMEEEMRKTGIKNLCFFRPSMLLGNRNEIRFGESLGKVIMKAFGFLFVGKLKKYKAIETEVVARAMMKVADANVGISVFLSDEIQKIGNGTS
jgi:uncharacterized protein YbjT (DUF2867 family)